MRGLGRLFRGRAEADASGIVEEEATRACPHCGERVSRGATVCLHCELDLPPLMSTGQFVQLFGTPDGPRVDHPAEGDDRAE